MKQKQSKKFNDPTKNKKKLSAHGKQLTGKAFWDAEYETHEHFALSDEASEELKKFTRFVEREHNGFPKHWNVIDAGCGNGRNLIWLGSEFAAQGLGYDFSSTAIELANKNAAAKRLNHLSFIVHRLEEPIPTPNDSADLVIDLMSSHVLNAKHRDQFFNEVSRVLMPGGWFVLKTFLLDEDQNAARMLKDYPTDEPGTYLHPRLGIREHVYSIDELKETLSPLFQIEKIQKSHAHMMRGKPNKRRFVVLYLTKPK
jgi:ubiquinone/menaquinone biosynthesis C-methylase UbiE